jgi:phospholipid/cholesterol/gamma-HCH transport system ATP-binding protein
MVKVQGLHLSYEGREVLRGIDLDVREGEILAIMGSSGGGKTTLLKCIAALLQPTKGDVLVDGLSVIRQPDEVHAKVGLVFQYAALFDFLNVADNVLFGVRRHKRLGKRAEVELLECLLEVVGLQGSARMMPSELSGGMRKRIGLARALALEPKVLLYDEPTSGLDPVTAYSIDGLIAHTRDRTRATSIVVSHDVTSVFRVADRIAFLHMGELMFLGTAEEFRQNQSPVLTELVERSRAESLHLDQESDSASNT